jgi:hypothetical protein
MHGAGRPSPGRRAGRVRDDAGGVWIVTGWVVGLAVYAMVVVAWLAGFGAAAPFVVIPAVLVAMIGIGNLINEGRSRRPAPRFNHPDPVPLAPRHPAPDDPSGRGADGDGHEGPDPGR